MKFTISKEWCAKMAKLEEGHEIGAGILHPEAQLMRLAEENKSALKCQNCGFPEADCCCGVEPT